MARIGVTMRVVETAEYRETRDALAHDWAAFFATTLPDAAWTPIPNSGAERALEFADRWGLDALVLTGGNDVGSSAVRDETEIALLGRALRLGQPVLAVCRGFQLVQFAAGGALCDCAEAHVGSTHAVSFVRALGTVARPGQVEVVNSYHRQGIAAGELVPDLHAVAVTDDGLVEAAVGREAHVLALQWHPERGRPFRDLDLQLVRGLFAREW